VPPWIDGPWSVAPAGVEGTGVGVGAAQTWASALHDEALQGLSQGRGDDGPTGEIGVGAATGVTGVELTERYILSTVPSTAMTRRIAMAQTDYSAARRRTD